VNSVEPMGATTVAVISWITTCSCIVSNSLIRSVSRATGTFTKPMGSLANEHPSQILMTVSPRTAVTSEVFGDPKLNFVPPQGQKTRRDLCRTPEPHFKRRFIRLGRPFAWARLHAYRQQEKLLFRQDREDYCVRCGGIVAQFDVQAGFGWMRNT
jgi:hypothetical protein